MQNSNNQLDQAGNGFASALLAGDNPMKKIRLTSLVACFDNGGKTMDRYTAVYLKQRAGLSLGKWFYNCVGMSANPFHPQGFGQHGTAMLGRHLGKRIALNELPADCQRLVMHDLGLQPA
jgi:hypothetical protein